MNAKIKTAAICGLLVYIVLFWWSSWLHGIDFKGEDIAYEAAYYASSFFDAQSFGEFTRSQAYPSVTLWLAYSLCNSIMLSYETSAVLLGSLYLVTSYLVSQRISEKCFKPYPAISFLLYIGFLSFGYFGIVVVVSALKMQLAFSFLFLHLLLKDNKPKMSILMIVLSIATHFSVIVIVAVLYGRRILSTASNACLYVVTACKIKKVYLLPFLLLPLAMVASGAVVAKLFFLFSATGNVQLGSKAGQIAVIAYSIFVLSWLYDDPLTTRNIMFYLLLLSPLLLNISLSRIAWLYAYSLFLYPMVDNGLRLISKQLFMMALAPLSLLYLARGLSSVMTSDLMF